MPKEHKQRDALWMIGIGILLFIFPWIGKALAWIAGIVLVVWGLVKLASGNSDSEEQGRVAD